MCCRERAADESGSDQTGASTRQGNRAPDGESQSAVWNSLRSRHKRAIRDPGSEQRSQDGSVSVSFSQVSQRRPNRLCDCLTALVAQFLFTGLGYKSVEISASQESALAQPTSLRNDQKKFGAQSGVRFDDRRFPKNSGLKASEIKKSSFPGQSFRNVRIALTRCHPSSRSSSGKLPIQSLCNRTMKTPCNRMADPLDPGLAARQY